MIKCNVTVNGFVSRIAERRADKDGNSYSAFRVSVVIPATSGINKTIEIMVTKDGDEDLSHIYPGSLIEVKGVLFIRKKDDDLSFNLKADTICLENVADENCIKGTMDFRGTLGKKPVETKTDKRGKNYRIYSGYSTDRIINPDNENKYSYIWVRFVEFDAADTDCLSPSASICVKGDLDTTLYNDNIRIGCRVRSLSPWDKNQKTISE